MLQYYTVYGGDGIWSCVAQLERHDACNARIVGLILVGARHKTMHPRL